MDRKEYSTRENNMDIWKLKYSPMFFYISMPEWKRKKDPPLTKIFYRPLSFVVSSLLASVGISANSISYFNVFIAIAAAVLFLLNDYKCAITGAILVNVWLLFDCVDGNIARSVRKQPYGEYADSMSSYFLVPLMCISLGMYTFENGGLFIEQQCLWMMLAGALAGLSDTMMRLIYHKYKEVTLHMISLGVVEKFNDERNDHSKVNSIRVRIESDWGIGGFLPLMTLLAVVLDATDLLLAYCILYFGGACIVTVGLFTYKAMKYEKITIVDLEDVDK